MAATVGSGVNLNGCADRVTATTNVGSSASFTIGSDVYKFDITGFGPSTDPLRTFWTIEGQDNAVGLTARYTLESNLPAVPLPAAGWLLAAGLGGLVAFGRRKAA